MHVGYLTGLCQMRNFEQLGLSGLTEALSLCTNRRNLLTVSERVAAQRVIRYIGYKSDVIVLLPAI